MYINADHLRTERRKPVPDTRNAEVLPNLREAVACYRHRTILQQCPVRKQVHSDGGTQQTMGKRRLIDANALLREMRYSGRAAYMLVLAAPTIDPETLRPVSEWELNPYRFSCEHFRCKKCHHIDCVADKYCGECGSKMKNAGVKPEDMPIPTETIQKSNTSPEWTAL